MRTVPLFFAYTPILYNANNCPNSLLATTTNNNDSSEKLSDIFAEIEDFKKSAKEKLTLAKLANQQKVEIQDDDEFQVHSDEREALIEEYMKNSLVNLKTLICTRLKVKSFKGNKPDIALKLAELDLMEKYGEVDASKSDNVVQVDKRFVSINDDELSPPLAAFAGISSLSIKAGKALAAAKFFEPTPVQAEAIPFIFEGKSAIIHAETGSGKTLSYLLPITETIAAQRRSKGEDMICLILTPTRELAAQVAGVASALLPKDQVRLVSKPTNLMDGGEGERLRGKRVIIGSAKALLTSLYGDGKMPASPTPKPLTSKFIKSIRWIVMDEVDKMLNINKIQQKGRAKGKNKKIHEKPAALLANAIARTEVEKSRKIQIVAASATVGRPMRRELSRVFGLTPSECPEVIRPKEGTETVKLDKNARVVTIPASVRNYYSAVGGEADSVGALLVHAASIIKRLPESSDRKILLVLTRTCGMNISNTIGALKHFKGNVSIKLILSVIFF